MEELVIGVRFKKTGKLCYYDPLKYKFKLGDNIIAKTAKIIFFLLMSSSIFYILYILIKIISTCKFKKGDFSPFYNPLCILSIIILNTNHIVSITAIIIYIFLKVTLVTILAPSNKAASSIPITS